MQLRTVLAVAAFAPALALAQPAPTDDAPPPPDDPVAAEPDPAVFAPEPPPAEVPVAPAKGAVSVRYDKGLTFETADGDLELKLALRSQFRLEVTRPRGDGSEFASRFMVPRLRLQFEGHAFGHANGYKVEFDLANRGFALLKDFYLEHSFGAARVRAGQWKLPFHRQEIVSDFGSEFLERSLTNAFSGAGRDLGVALHNNYEKSPDGLEWAVGVFNSTGERASSRITCQPGATPTDPPTCTAGTPTNVPGDWGPSLVAHAGWNSGGIKGYSEGDLEGGPLRYAVSASYQLDPNDFDEDAAGDLQLEHALAVDAMIKAQGVSVTGSAVLVKDGQADAELGFYGQVSYFMKPQKLLLAGRFSQVPEGDELKHEILGAVNVLWRGHTLKWMIDGGVIHTTGDTGGSDLQIRTQLQGSI